MKTGRWLAIAGCLLSFLTAILHGLGFAEVSGALGRSNAPPVMVAAAKCLWLVFSVQFILLSAMGAAAIGSSRAKQLVLLCSLFPIFDAGLMLNFVGPFFGVYIVAAVGAFLLAGGYCSPARRIPEVEGAVRRPPLFNGAVLRYRSLPK